MTDKSEGFPYPAYPDYEKGHIFHPNDAVVFWKGATYEFQVTNAVINNMKAHDWNNNRAYGNKGNLAILPGQNEVKVYFKPVVQLTVTNNLEGASGGNYKLKWITGGQVNPVVRSSGETDYVFKHDSLNNNPNVYEIEIPETIDDFNDSDWGFVNWDNGTFNTKRILRLVQNQNNFTANYKASLRTDAFGSFATGSQRKIVRTDNGYLHLVYESMGKVWYEMSTNNGSSWNLVCSAGLFEFAAKTPSLDYLGNKVFLVLHDQYNKIMLYVFENGNYINELEIAGNTNYLIDATPVVACGATNQFAVVWKSGSGIKYSYGNIVNSIVGLNSSGQITGTSGNSMYPTAAAKNEPGSVFHLHIAWQELLSNSTYKIYYMDYLSNSNNTQILPQLTTPYCVSYGCGYTHCSVPSIIVLADGDVIAAWNAARSSSGEHPGEPLSKETGFGSALTEFKAIYKKKNNGEWFSAFHVYGDNASGVNVNSAGNNFAMCYYIGQNSSRYIKSTSNSINTFPVAGTSPHISNGIDLNSMRSAAHEKNLIPGRINVSTTGLSKINSPNYISHGREGVVYIDTLQFFFALGDILVDDCQVRFIDYPDSIGTVNLDTLNKYVVSEPFQLNDYSSFVYSVIYGYYDSLAAVNMLGENNIRFRVKLIDDITGEEIGVYDDVTYSSQGVFPYSTFLYNVSTAGIGNKTVRLILETSTGLNASYSFSDRTSDNSSISKLYMSDKRYDGKSPIKHYDLLQNYPNPFNPTTTIKYTMPEDGIVTIKVFDVLGREIKTLVNTRQLKGEYSVEFDASGLASGMYIYQIRMNDYVQSKKMVLIR
ncbi:MAG: T9SS type A sorting domain-containing protein [bacterium]